MKNAFTMIELIFVIVIIGILAAVAIPKLAATRADAEGVKITNNLAICVGDTSSAYLITGFFSGDNTRVDTTPLGSTTCASSQWTTTSGVTCYTMIVSDVNGTISITETLTSSKVCLITQAVSRKNGMSDSNGTTILKL